VDKCRAQDAVKASTTRCSTFVVILEFVILLLEASNFLTQDLFKMMYTLRTLNLEGDFSVPTHCHTH